MHNIIFSKDRPLQLALTIDSIKKNWGGDIDVIFTYSTKEYHKAYTELINEYEDVSFLKQSTNLFNDVIKAIKTRNDDYVCFFTDDDIVFQRADRYLSSEALHAALDDTACLSLRLGCNISKRDIGGNVIDDVIPRLFPCTNSLMKWNRTSVPTGGYWSYPLSVDGHVFKSEVISEIMKEMSSWVQHCKRELTFRYDGTPNMLERLLQRFWFELPPLMAAPKFSCVVNSPNNRVQNSVLNRSGDHFEIRPLYALEIFNSGKRISIDGLMDSDPNISCPHQELDLLSYLEKK